MDVPMEHVQVPPDFDPWSQNLNITVSDGQGGWVIVTRNMQDLDQYRYFGFRLAISYGAGFGACLLLFLVLLITTKADRRKSSLFLLNAACVFTNCIRCLLFSTWLTGEFYNPYSVLSQDWRRITDGDFANHIAINIFGIVVNALVFTSLSLQVWTVCVTTPPLQRSIIMTVTIIMAGVSFGYRVAAVYYNTKLTLAYQPTDSIEYLVSISYMLQTVAIWLFSCVFTWKLGFAILQRRRLNMPQFGPIQVVFIMGCQTMLVPAIFSSLQFAAFLPEIVTHVLTVVCIFLPLSAIWAGVVNDQDLASRGPDAHQRLIRNDYFNSGSSATMVGGSTVCDKSRQMSVWSDTKSKDVESIPLTPTVPVHKSMNSNEIRVDRDFNVSCHDAASRV
ncbi:hypothetical protein COCC4DRAFT_56759 [Bipolaris maydis ATCC 48331]|uniref:Pheromone receptor n=2 Tax=Cochliobolus heterostrophus TaxID=5016 RepID=M2URM4_COCH5|nr:uncharacterized protein COCC4DRAFT_56759 [Bipolaris maydis ATCC 48331]EMD90553.1 hypothetical protein COCHEDRAFT_1215526 [Bipolaris maydis C5]KAH7555492.1 hypothetical protein BM1_07115 [Bipolaris maydis]ENI09235.1 hypothetical protein COCC4DRAFT_56759 [Bipolaris maydis ATCC 48331]KAJ5023629.1 fungal pheromone mating factor STE2 GPCR-domain-containing protein [Bipolaris maydis]KAJ5058427.1 fungal pheromone mating factor STE2 GPCR-domain-containing protein [Bipolaris maydis]